MFCYVPVSKNTDKNNITARLVLASRREVTAIKVDVEADRGNCVPPRHVRAQQAALFFFLAVRPSSARTHNVSSSEANPIRDFVVAGQPRMVSLVFFSYPLSLFPEAEPMAVTLHEGEISVALARIKETRLPKAGI